MGLYLVEPFGHGQPNDDSSAGRRQRELAKRDGR
jgi:hypothetical protein